MINSLVKARKLQKKAIESIYEGVCTVTEYMKVTDDTTHITHNQEIVLLENEPCRLSFENIQVTDKTDTVSNTVQKIKLFISPNIVIKPGSKITVTQNGITSDYTYSSVPSVYLSHQEIVLELFKEYA
jgi:hypothetical protein